MRERKKPSQSWIERSIEEIEKEAFNKGWEAGFAMACEITHKFADLVSKMREAQKEFESDSPHMDYDKIMEVYRDKFHLESEVDEYLKKMEI